MTISSFKKKVKNIYFLLKGKSLALNKTVTINNEWCGNQYGGFYVSTDYLNENAIIYSFGIGEDISFDLQLINEFKCKVYGFDPTPKSINWVNQQQITTNFIFSDYGIGKETEWVTFYLPKNTNHVSGSMFNFSTVNELEPIVVSVKKFIDIASEFNHKIIDVLKMDIEGSEYGVIPSILESGVIIKQILIEFHHRMFDDGAKLTKESISLLKAYGFELYAFSDTNEELSFVNINFIE